MFSKVALFTTAFMAVFVAAGSIENSCDTGEIHCCNDIKDANANGVSSLLTLLGVAAGSVTGKVGLNCSPISAVGLGGNSCSAQPTCCSGNNFNGLVVLGCSPLNSNL